MSTTKPTMADVALEAGVSRATVSFVLNEAADQSISTQTRRRVLAAAERLGYAPNVFARALRTGASRLIVLDLGGLPRGSLLDGYIAGLHSELHAAGYGLLVTEGTAQNAAEAAAVRLVSPHAVIDLAAMYDADEEPRDGGWRHGMAAHLATQLDYLRGRGHHRIAVAVQPGPERFLGLLVRAARTHAERIGMTVVDEIRTADTAETDRKVAALPRAATAVAALSDDAALAVLAAAADRSIGVPDPLAVIGFGDGPFARLWRPPLTSVRLNTSEYGRRAARDVLGSSPSATPAPRASVIARVTA